MIADKRGFNSDGENREDETKLFVADPDTAYGITGTVRVHEQSGSVALSVREAVQKALERGYVRPNRGKPLIVPDAVLEEF